MLLNAPSSRSLGSNARRALAVDGPASAPMPVSAPSASFGTPPVPRPAVGSRELPDVTGFLVVLLVTVGLFVVPVGATLMQGPAIVASLFAGH